MQFAGIKRQTLEPFIQIRAQVETLFEAQLIFAKFAGTLRKHLDLPIDFICISLPLSH